MELVYELRIGNLVSKSLKSGTGRTLIEKVGPQDIVRIYENISHFNYYPILITEEWLLKFGFKSETYLKKYVIIKEVLVGSIFVQFDKDNSMRVGSQFSCIENTLNIKYVHQLQNLYFALTQTELEIK